MNSENNKSRHWDEVHIAVEFRYKIRKYSSDISY